MAAVEDRNRQQIHDPQSDTDEPHENQEIHNTGLGRFGGHLGDQDRASQIFRGDGSGQDLVKRYKRDAGDIDCLQESFSQSVENPVTNLPYLSLGRHSDFP